MSSNDSTPHPSLFKYLDSTDFTHRALTVVIVGASGHLARTQVIPAIFSLFCKRLLPQNFHLVGYARSDMDDKKFRGNTLEAGLKGYESHELHNMELQEDQAGNDEKKEYTAVSSLLSMIGFNDKGKNNSAGDRVSESDRQLRSQFLSRCYYVRGKYDQPADYAKLVSRMEELEKKNEEGGGNEQKGKVEGVNRIFYLAIPPTSFSPALDCIHSIRGSSGWTRIVVEKPFGEDLESAKKLNALVQSKFKEDEVYRIDHFMGKETLQNIIPLRFSNPLYNRLWNAESVSSIEVNVKESFGLEGRAGYFDDSGIVRDMIQNHLLSIVALCTMEEPEGKDDNALHKAKTAVFKAMKAVVQEDIVVGQYGASEDGKKVGYAEDKGVKKGTKTSTYVAVVVHIDNERWKGVPILMHCGKALNTTKSEIYINFKSTRCRPTLHHTSLLIPPSLLFTLCPHTSPLFAVVSVSQTLPISSIQLPSDRARSSPLHHSTRQPQVPRHRR